MIGKLLLSLLLATAALVANAQAVQYTWAKNGLNMRSSPDKTAPVIRKLPFGRMVTLLEHPGRQDSVKEFSGFYIKGRWQKVLAGNDTGYVFDGYLSSYRQAKEEEGEFPTFDNFLIDHFGPRGERQVLEYYDSAYCRDMEFDDCARHIRWEFAKGASLEAWSGESGSSATIIIPGHSVQEVYLWSMHYAPRDETYETIRFENGMIVIEPVEGAGCTTFIREEDGKIYWEQSCGC